MPSFTRFVVDIIVILTIFGLIFYIYQTYSSVFIDKIFGEQKVAVMINQVTVNATLADTPKERSNGLSNVASLPQEEGMLFVFDQEGYHRFWMKDMLLPLDIIWIDNDFKIVHIESNVSPDTYPATFGSPQAARFVLETNAFFTNTFNIHVGDWVSIPANRLPDDLR